MFGPSVPEQNNSGYKPPSTISISRSGTHETSKAELPAVSYDRHVKLFGTAWVKASVRGDLVLEITGTKNKCISGRHYRNEGMPQRLEAEVSCEDFVPAKMRRVYIAKETNNDAASGEIELKVTWLSQ